MDVVDSRGRPVRLGSKLGQGGEGSVFEIATSADIVAKIYHRPPSALRAEKIRAMAALRTEQIDKLTAWPIEVLSLRSGAPIGLTMPRIVGYKDIHHLYSPKSRRTEFPGADWRFLVRTATNLARAFATVHDTSSIIADVNHSGVLVAPDARVRLIDCDSFQVVDRGRRYLCDVGVPTFTPPELQGRPFSELLRTENHDNFGLAVLIFLVLFMGRHPFAGRYIGSGEMTIEQAIGEGRFAYGADALAAQMERPPGTPPLDIVSGEVANLFERAFDRRSAGGGRPTARQWVSALEILELGLIQCTASEAHWHYAQLPACPWCQMEAATSVPLFAPTLSAGVAAHFDLETFWHQVEAVPHPGPAPVLEDAVSKKNRIKPSDAALAFRRRHWFHLPLALFVAAAPLSVGIFAHLPPLARLFFFISSLILYVLLRRSLRATASTAAFLERDRYLRSRWDEVRNEWDSKAGPRMFEQKRAELDRLRVSWTRMPELRTEKLRDLIDNKRDIELTRFLDRFEIGAADIPGVGVGRKSLLQSFGVESAADVTEQGLIAVPGFGAKLRGSMLAWRRSLETQFTFDSTEGYEQDRGSVDQLLLAERLRIASAIRKGFADLQQIAKQVQFARSSLRTRGEDVYRAHLEAEIDLRYVSR
jgi:DNA-binding helix-hairpin-helix protein with protein kinase domain